MVIDNPLLSRRPIKEYSEKQLKRWVSGRFDITEPISLFAFQGALSGLLEVRGVLFALAPDYPLKPRIAPGHLYVFPTGNGDPLRKDYRVLAARLHELR